MTHNQFCVDTDSLRCTCDREDYIKDLESDNKRLREALERFADKNNWGYFDPSGCPKGVGESVESWVHNSDPVLIAKSALDGGKP